jgi:NADPH:quinone reductase-like Zn-dependent oxidoreductase
MKRWQLEKSKSLHLIESPLPEPGTGEILVHAKAVSLKYRDKLMIEDQYLHPVSFPLVPGSDLAGEVVAVGSDKQNSLKQPTCSFPPARRTGL